MDIVRFTIISTVTAAKHGIPIPAAWRNEIHTVRFNVGPISPLGAREMQSQRHDPEVYSPAVYNPPGKGQAAVSLAVSKRERTILSALRGNRWVDTQKLKTNFAETRKPLSDLRVFGLIIGTKSEPDPLIEEGRTYWMLLGDINLFPTKEDLKKAKPILQTLPTLSRAAHIERAKAEAKFERRLSNIDQTVNRHAGY